MEVMEDPLHLLLALLAVIVAVVVSFIWRTTLSKKSAENGRGGSWTRSKLPPGSMGLPLVGETLKLIAAYKTENPEPFIDERVQRYGRLFTTHLFGERTVFSADPEFNRLVLAAEGRIVECSYPSSISTLLGSHSLLLMKGQPHKRLHSLTLNRLGRPATMITQIDALVHDTLESWGSCACVGLMEQAKKITFDLTIKQLLSFDPGVWSEDLRREYVVLIDGFFSIPFPSFLSFTAYGRAIKARKKVADALREILRKRKEERKAKIEEDEEEEKKVDDVGGRRKYKKDMVDELLTAEGGTLSEEEMVDFLIALLVAGYETTSIIMTLAVKFVTETPSALALLKEEHDRIRAMKKDEEPLDWSDYKSMSFTQCVINETLRVANNISGVFRRAVADIDFKGHTIPKGCKIFASFRAVHLDTEHYENARTFDPCRWQSHDAIQHAVGSSIFTPFGGGPRLCPGNELARVVISVFLHHLITRFSWEAAEEDRLVFFPTTRTMKGYPINVCRRGKALV